MTTGLQSEDSVMLDSYAETVRIPVLPESGLQQDAGSETSAGSFDPYNSSIGRLTVRPRPAWTPDDMRRLSKAIVRNRLRAK